MLSLLSERTHGLCDGISRREFLTIGALGFGGMSMPQLLAAEAASGSRSKKAIIMVLLSGGPSHQDLFDLKTEAPKEVRGEFNPIPTSVSGIEICEHLPLMAGMMDKLAIVRSVVGAQPSHVLHQCHTGRTRPDYWPSIGSTISKVQGTREPGVPPFVGLAGTTKHGPWSDSGQYGFLGPAHGPMQLRGNARSNMVLNVPLERLRDRRQLISSVDQFRREVNAGPILEGFDSFRQQAFGVLTSSKLVEALDFEREDPQVRERYGRGSLDNIVDGPPLYNEHFLVARRLVEAGVRCVTLSFGRWDTHADDDFDGVSNFETLRNFLPRLDKSVTALVQDLHNRGMDKDVSVIVWGEFGRTPKINDRGGRDHWPNVSCALMAGGGMRTGQVIGTTDRIGGEAASRPVTFQEIFSTLYHNVGINATNTTVTDLSGRPQYLVDHHTRPISELV